MVATFLQKIPQIYKPGTLCASFYNNITSTTEIKTFEEVKTTFLQLDHESVCKNAPAKTGNDKNNRNTCNEKTENVFLNEIYKSQDIKIIKSNLYPQEDEYNMVNDNTHINVNSILLCTGDKQKTNKMSR